MQPESPSLSTPLPPTLSQAEPRDPLEQHGLLLHQHSAGDVLPPNPEHERVGTQPRQGRRVSPPGSARSESPNGGVSLVGTPSRAVSGHPKNRIDEYERAAASPPVGNKRRGGPAFEVVKKVREPGDKRSPVSDLPNELLTHTLSHLAAADMASVSLVSKRFHQLVTEPHAWRSAFARYFPGPDSIDALEREDALEDSAVIRSERRAFTRLTPLASWRSEYILRTRLLRSLARGKPSAPPGTSSSANGARGGSTHAALPHWDYSSHLYTTVNRLHATFGTGLNKRLPRFIHGADDVGNATSSDPNVGKVDGWGLRDMQVFRQFWEHFPGDEMYGLGPGVVVGVPNVMDVSQPYGMIHGEGTPGRTVYFRSTEEQRGRFLLLSSAISDPQAGIPRISSVMEAHCSVWIAKSAAVPSLTDGLIGMLAGSSLGVLTAYSLGSANGTNLRDRRFDRGEMTARWVLSPGVPLIAITVDNEYSPARQAQNRIWAVVLNALGEVFYLTKFPQRPHVEAKRLDDEGLERTAWLTGRSVYWNLVEPSRRAARQDVYGKNDVDGSYSPRSSWTGMCLSKEQVQAETREIETFAARKPIDFRNACVGWDMQRRLEVDFAGDDENHAGEAIVVVECGLEEDNKAAVKRHVRCRFQERSERGTTTPPSLTEASARASSSPSLFGGATTTPPTISSPPSFSFDSLRDTLSQDGMDGSTTPRPMLEEWRSSTLTLNGLKGLQISASTLDQSTHATQTLSEDPLLSFSTRSTASSPSLTPTSSSDATATSPTDVPGQRARLLALGTLSGSVLLWNIRTPFPTTAIPPLRIIHTASPQIASLALSSLYLVHGGNDGLVQAWDPLASSPNPIRTLHSRHASRARRRIVQAQASALGVGVNNYAAGAVALDPDPTVLRGVVALGTHLRYWSYSSGGADAYKSSKRRLRRGERGSNAGNASLGIGGAASRGKIGDFIAHERSELEREKVEKAKKQERLAGRFGTELLEGSEEELLAYAAMLSQESHEMEMVRRVSESSGIAPAEMNRKREGERTKSGGGDGAVFEDDADMDPDVARAIRLSLAETNGSPSPGMGNDTDIGIPIRQARQKGGRKSSFAVGSLSPSPSPDPGAGVGASNANELSDLDFAIQLSLAEERSRIEGMEGGGGEFPVLENGFEGKGKGRAG